MGEDQEGAGPGVESVSCHEGLVRLLAEQFARADVSLRELQARADTAGGPRLPQATCADMLAGRRFPNKAVMVSFLLACGVPEHRVPEWERAWERVRTNRMPPSGFQLTRTALSLGVPPFEHSGVLDVASVHPHADPLGGLPRPGAAPPAALNQPDTVPVAGPTAPGPPPLPPAALSPPTGP
ncbi:hypothetical protein [Nonomuraea sp. NPDC001831]|uniref:hypothetical protein n=1 Tax=Nonomuraea sp. NPDC001831 TaxID=3364340 RepID=UPI00368041AD